MSKWGRALSVGDERMLVSAYVFEMYDVDHDVGNLKLLYIKLVF